MKDTPGSDDYRDPDRYDYHYDRDERMSRLSPESRSHIEGVQPKGIFRRNRTLTIILVDILIIAVVWFVFLPLIRTGAVGSLDGYNFSLHAFSYGGNALISLKVVRDSDKIETGPSYSAVFGLSSSDRSEEMQGVLPAALKASTTLRTSLPLSGKTTAVVCTVKLSGKELHLKARLRSE